MRWLTEAELDSWFSVIRLITWLPWSIDQLRQEAEEQARRHGRELGAAVAATPPEAA